MQFFSKENWLKCFHDLTKDVKRYVLKYNYVIIMLTESVKPKKYCNNVK